MCCAGGKLWAYHSMCCGAFWMPLASKTDEVGAADCTDPCELLEMCCAAFLLYHHVLVVSCNRWHWVFIGHCVGDTFSWRMYKLDQTPATFPVVWKWGAQRSGQFVYHIPVESSVVFGERRKGKRLKIKSFTCFVHLKPKAICEFTFNICLLKQTLFSIEIALRFLISLNKHNASPCQRGPLQL